MPLVKRRAVAHSPRTDPPGLSVKSFIEAAFHPWFAGLALSLVIVNSTVAGSPSATVRATDAERPNLVVFLVDDMGWQDTSVPFHDEVTPFNRHFRTPAMERIAAQGIRFTNAYSCSVCSPTRTSLMTGLNAARHGVTNWTLRKDGETSHKTDRLGPPKNWRRNGLQPEDLTLPSLLREAGYRTIHVGKAHWGTMTTPGSDPTQLGFDVNIAGHAAGGPGHFHGTKNYGNKEKGGHTPPWGVPGLEKYHGTDTHLTDALTIEACAAVTEAVNLEQPFYLYLAHYTVHAPIQPHEPYTENYRGKKYPGTDIEIPEKEVRYASMIEGMDASLGQVLKHLEKLRVAEQTLVVFASDNGGLSAHARDTTPHNTGLNTHCRPLRAGKGSAYEGGTRVPFMVSWAVRSDESALQASIPISAGTLSHRQTIIEDLFPTLLRWGGAWGLVPDEHVRKVGGRDIADWVTGASDEPRDVPLVFHYPHVWSPGPYKHQEGYEPHSSVRDGRYKAIYFYHPRRWELYDLEADLGEEKDLAAHMPGRLEACAKYLKRYLIAVDASWPVNLESGEEEPLLLPDEIPTGSD